MIHRIGRIALLAVIPGWLHAQSARDIAEHVDPMTRGASSRADLFTEVVTAHWSRSLTLKVWSPGTDYALVRVMAPLKEAGTATPLPSPGCAAMGAAPSIEGS